MSFPERERLHFDRKPELRRVVGQRIPITFADHTDASGIALFERASKLDLEGIVATHKLSGTIHSGSDGKSFSSVIAIRSR